MTNWGYLSVLLSELVQDVGGVEAGVVAQLAGNHLERKVNLQLSSADAEGFGSGAHLEGLGHGGDDELLLAGDRPGVVPQVL